MPSVIIVNSARVFFYRKLPDHVSLLEVAKAHEVLDAIVEKEEQLWSSLCNFHFTQEQTAKIKRDSISWRHAFFELKKYCGLREFYADLIHLCCQCKAIFWKVNALFWYRCLKEVFRVISR